MALFELAFNVRGARGTSSSYKMPCSKLVIRTPSSAPIALVCFPFRSNMSALPSSKVRSSLTRYFVIYPTRFPLFRRARHCTSPSLTAMTSQPS